MKPGVLVLFFLSLARFGYPQAPVDQLEKLPECDEYLSKSPCKVTINVGKHEMAVPDSDQILEPRAHFDVQVKPFRRILHSLPAAHPWILLEHSSPFMSCRVAATPAAPGRDLSANIGTALTAIAGIGAPSLSATIAFSLVEPSPSANLALPPPSPELAAIEADIAKLRDDVKNDFEPYQAFNAALKKDWTYTFANEQAAENAINELKKSSEIALATPLPDADALARRVLDIDRRLTNYSQGSHPGEENRIEQDQAAVLTLKAALSAPKELTSRITDLRKNIRSVLEQLYKIEQAHAENTSYTTQAAEMGYFSNKTVTETVTCKDKLTDKPVFDNVIFTAYYETVPHIDVSVGAMASLLGGRQVGTITAPFTPAQAASCTAAAASGSTAACGPSTILGYKTQSSYQFMPGVFLEWRLLNERCPWAKNGAPWHPGGYMCSFGLAGGVDINPNNGGPAAEFFEGVSFGVQRFAFLFGIHNGRYQQYGGGYYVGETFPAGSTVSPPTQYNWANHPAFGIAYRIPLR